MSRRLAPRANQDIIERIQSDVALTGRCDALEGCAPPPPRIWTGALAALPQSLAAQGIDAGDILAAAGLSFEQLQEEQTFITMETYARTLELAAEATGDPLFALHFGEHFPSSHNHVLFYVYSKAPVLQTAIESAVRYIRLVARMSASFELSDGDGIYAFACAPPLAVYIHKDRVGMARWLKLFQSVLGQDWRPVSASFAHAEPADTAEYVRLFGDNLAFGEPTNAIRLSARDLATTMPAADPDLFSVLQSYCDKLLNDLGREEDPLHDVRSSIAENLAGGRLSPADVAKDLNISEGVLKRRLRDAGIAFRDLQDDLRRALANRYLVETELSQAEIAFLLGFSEQSAFTRAFKRCFGMTPRSYRKAHQGQSAAGLDAGHHQARHD